MTPSVDEPAPRGNLQRGRHREHRPEPEAAGCNIKVLVEGIERGKIVSVAEDAGFLRAVVRTYHFKVEPGPQLEALVARVSGSSSSTSSSARTSTTRP